MLRGPSELDNLRVRARRVEFLRLEHIINTCPCPFNWMCGARYVMCTGFFLEDSLTLGAHAQRGSFCMSVCMSMTILAL